METVYNRFRPKTKRRTRPAVSDDRQQHEKTLRVVSFPQGDEYVPSVRVAGKWLRRFGFHLGDEVTLTAAQGQILIIRKEGENHGGSLV